MRINEKLSIYKGSLTAPSQELGNRINRFPECCDHGGFSYCGLRAGV